MVRILTSAQRAALAERARPVGRQPDEPRPRPRPSKHFAQVQGERTNLGCTLREAGANTSNFPKSGLAASAMLSEGVSRQHGPRRWGLGGSGRTQVFRRHSPEYDHARKCHVPRRKRFRPSGVTREIADGKENWPLWPDWATVMDHLLVVMVEAQPMKRLPLVQVPVRGSCGFAVKGKGERSDFQAVPRYILVKMHLARDGRRARGK